MERSPLPRRGLLLAALLLAWPAAAPAQTGYLSPPAPIPQILDAPPTPSVNVAPDHKTLALLGRENLPSIAELSEEWLGLAGFRVNPRTNGQAASRLSFVNAITFQDLETGARREVRLPAGARVSYAQWSPDSEKLAFAMFGEGGIELWVADARTAQARRLLPEVLNGAAGVPFGWLPDASGLLARRVPEGRGPAPVRSRVPAGPIIQESSGRAAPARTFQDLLQDATDERLFEHYFTSQLVVVSLDGTPRTLGRPGLVTNASVSPDGRYVLVTRMKRPFSYVVTAQRFPQEVEILDMTGRVVKQVADIPLTDNLSPARDAVAPGPRSARWRADAPATLAWVEAQDGGDPRRAAPVRDRLYVLDAPFTAQPRVLADLDQRFGGVTWGRGDFALVTSRWFDTRREKRWVVAPDRPGQAPRLLAERGSQDRYGDPGDPVTVENRAGHDVLLFTPDGRGVYLAGSGASPRGDYPFLDRMDIASGRSTRLWQAADPHYETVQAVLAADGSRILTRRESAAEAPNYFVRTLPGGQARAITAFADPAPQLAGITRQLINYERADGVKLSGTLYLPAGYDARRDGPLPLLMWAYPTEFASADAAGQVRDSPNRFSRPGGISHLFVLTQGYAVLDDPAMPIIGEGGKENDTYVEQLVASAKAAVDKVVEMGVADRDRIAVGGHSYGAFMTANLLAHSDLFRAGIARSGAYNRTLTPFGFQSEQRTYWEATDIYTRLSPFTYANRVNEPILLIHGGADDNSGTFPIQSERFYAALKGHGATVRYVVLPYEAHGYRARESTGHTLAEMLNWLDRYVKNAGPRQPAAATPTR